MTTLVPKKNNLLKQIRPAKITFYLLLTFWFVVSIISIIYLTYRGFGAEYFLDYANYMTGTRIVKDGLGHLLYDLPTQFKYQDDIIVGPVGNNILPYRAMPILILLYFPLTYLPLRLSYSVFDVIASISFILLARIMGKNISNKYLPLLFLFGFPTVFRSIYNGQPLFITIALLYLAYVFYTSHKDSFLGVVIGLLVFKPHVFIVPFFIFYLLSRNKVRFLIGIAVSLSVTLIISFVIVGPSFLQEYINFVLSTETVALGNRDMHYYSLDLLYKLVFPGEGHVITRLCLNFAIFAAFLFWFEKIKNKLQTDRLFFVIAFAMILFGFHTYNYDLVVLLVPVFLFITRIMQKRDLTEKEYLFLIGVYFGIFFLSSFAFIPFAVRPLYYAGLCCIIASDTVLPT